MLSFRGTKVATMALVGYAIAVSTVLFQTITAVTGILVMVAILASVATALVGPVTFFSLLVANLAYMLINSYRHSLVLPAAAMIAVLTLTVGQLVLERVLAFDTALSIVIEFLGGLAFLFLLVRGSVR